jgi:hypothetical protein
MKSMVTLAAALGALVATSALAQTPPTTPEPGAQKHPGMMMQHHAMPDGTIKPNGAAGRHHRRSCFDASWQSEAWKRCESMMGSPEKRN